MGVAGPVDRRAVAREDGRAVVLVTHDREAARIADRVLALNLLHEVVGEGALAEMRRLLSNEGFLLAVDWDSEVERDDGPPAHVALSQTEARRMLEEAGFEALPVAADEFPYHYAFIARRAG